MKKSVAVLIDRVAPRMTAKETAKLMAWGLGPDWQAANASAPISNVVNGIRRGMFVAPTANQAKVKLVWLGPARFVFQGLLILSL